MTDIEQKAQDEALCRAIKQIEDLRQPTHRSMAVAAAPADRIGGGGGLPCGVVGVATQIDAADSARLEYEIAQDIIRCLCPEPDAWPGTNGVKAMARKLVPLRQPTQSDALRAALEALEGMVRYSGMRESWQDDNPQYVVAAYDAIDVINAALQEQSK